MSLENVISEVFELPASAVQDSLEFSQIPDWDSMTHMVLIVRLEEDFKVQLDGDEIAMMKSVGDTRRVLKAHGIDV